MMSGDGSDVDVELGEFPFPITEGPDESRQLTWLRNHSNYMAVNGLFDYLRAIGVLVRGILVNFLIFLPYLLGISLIVAVSTFVEQPPPFVFTKGLLILFAVWILIFPVATPLRRIVRFKKTRATGSDSSVAQRDRYERSFGKFLFAILTAAVLESLPGLLGVYHSELDWPTLASMMAVATAVFTIFPKILSLIGKGLARKVALIAVGALGLAVPLLVVLFAADFIVSGPPVDGTIWTRVAGLPFPVMILAAVAIGWGLGAFNRADLAGISLVVAASAGLVWVVYNADIVVHAGYIAKADSLQDEAVVELRKDTVGIAQLADYVSEHPGPQLNNLIHELGKPLTQSPDTGGSRLRELADVGEAAGLYLEFGEVVDAITARVVECDAQEINTDECGDLNQEVRRLQSSATVLRDAYTSRSRGNLATHLISIDKQNIDTLLIDTLPELPANYPLLTQMFVSDSLCQDPIPRSTGPARRDCFTEVLTVLNDWGVLFLGAQRELATTASISLSQSAFYATEAAQRVHSNAFWPKMFFVSILAIQLGFFCFLTVDVNLTSIHGLYRDRLATAFLIGKDTEGQIAIEKDIDLDEICCHDAGSTAPYHLINAALNLQGSKDIGIRDRKSDFFIFSKKFIGGKRTGYCRSETMEWVFPQMDLATAMAISAAAAAPNMGRGTSPALVAVMTLLNIRLGFWVPNPDLIEKWLAKTQGNDEAKSKKSHRYSFDDVFRTEAVEIKNRWAQLPGGSPDRSFAIDDQNPLRLQPTPEHGLVGLSFSGGGIRSATVNLGIAQTLHRSGVFDHVDYMSTVSGGGYLGSAISTLMRQKTKVVSDTPRSAHADGTEIAVAPKEAQGSVGQLFRWRVRPAALVREILGRLDETSRWVNVSDGGHIENLGAIELLRRRCKYIIVGDGEADPNHHFNGLATLIRTARIDLGVHIEIKVDAIRLRQNGLCREHWAVGRIRYPDEEKRGYLLYLKSSVTGDEDEVIQQYRSGNPSFPHESTADQFFAEGQFEAYRGLGQHIGEQVLEHPTRPSDPGNGPTQAGGAEQTPRTNATSEKQMSFANLETRFETLWRDSTRQIENPSSDQSTEIT